MTSIKLNKTSGTLTVGDTIKLKATVKISKGGKKNVVWTSSNAVQFLDFGNSGSF